ncbi:hypothetical protein BWI93_18930 [Siphonobacter sp. BAB-5385]|uniref:3-keto-disaccharide hydrolase n=1 Tax=unclassified Siphonobacter TaxID=2635712 RepID=UPI000B9ED50D|nr:MULTISPECIES: DUF1080 domain-containing protein [unclassified Siphonobacter]OZI06625.1 hypothetical protein BWI93_18930 [Siphonobacter sp. BAB-5385]PMD90692.1 hypothetical protein BWI97_22160 [Siphonobacter sp. BAB-5405]
MKKVILSLLMLAVCTASKPKPTWIYLFDGKSTAALRGYRMQTFPTDAWKVEEGALVTQTGVPNIDLVTKESFKDFELAFQWKVSEAGNSGVFYYMKEDAASQAGNGNSPNWLDNFEMQILDDINFNDKEPKRSAGSLYDLITPTNKKLRPVGTYNDARLIVNKNHVEHWLNGEKVVTYEIGSKDLQELIRKSKFSSNPKFATSTDGLLMFQHHGQKVWLRDIKIRRL